MKTTITLILIFGAFFFWFNPTMDDFSLFVNEYAETKITDEVGETPLGKVIADFTGSMSGLITSKVTKRDDYYLFSIYTIGHNPMVGEKASEMKIFGFVKTFVPLDEPESWGFVGDAKSNEVFN